jgi:hypothetical protein
MNSRHMALACVVWQNKNLIKFDYLEEKTVSKVFLRQFFYRFYHYLCENPYVDIYCFKYLNKNFPVRVGDTKTLFLHTIYDSALKISKICIFF